MNVPFIERGRRNTERLGPRLHIALGGLHRLLHDVAQLASRGDPPFAGQRDRLDGQQLAADFGPGEPRGHADQILALGLAETEPPDASIFIDIPAGDADPLGLLHQDVFDGLAGQIGDLTLKVTNPGLAREIADQVAQCIVADRPLGLFEAVSLDLLWDQVALGDFDLLVLGVAGDANDLHAVHQRLRHAQRVGRGDEHHVREVVIDLEIMVVEGRVLLRVEHL